MEEVKETAKPKLAFSAWCRKNPLELFASFLCAVLTVIILFQVILRYALHFPLDWSEELAMVIFQWVSFIGAGLAVRYRFHFLVDLLTQRLPDRFRIITDLLASLSVLTVAYVMVHVGIMIMNLTKGITLPVMHFSKAYVYLAIPIGGAFMIIYQIPILVKQIRRLFGRK